MDKVFNLDSPLMRGLSKLADLVILNILTFVCCIPIVTIGAALTAQHYVVLKMVRNEEGYIVRSFFKSFKQNFKQATCIWLIMAVFIAMFVVDVYLFAYAEMQFPQILKIIVFAVALIFLFFSVYVFPVLAKFDNSVKNTMKNAFIISIFSLPKTVAMVIIYAVPIGILFVSLQLLPVAALFGFSGTAYLCAMLYDGTFKKFEPEVQEESEGILEENTEEITEQ